jgi:alpha-tubulin suppressor-like RCC1 family protein
LSDSFSVRLPDGRVWFDHLRYDIYDDSKRIRQLWHALADPLPRSAGVKQFIAGSNWVSVTTRHVDYQKDKFHVAGYLDTIGIKADGSLWISAASENGAWTADRMSQFGNQMDWRQANRARSQVLLLKNDGSLWVWGTNQISNWTNWSQNWPSVRDTQPRQIGLGSNWKEFYGGWRGLAQKNDGSVWNIGLNDKTKQWETHRETNLDNVSLPTLSLGGNQMAYVRPDGTLWARWHEQNPDFDTGFVQVGTQTNWHNVAINWSKMVGLKSDGSLWEWHFNRGRRNLSLANFAQQLKQPPMRLGIHDDWVALAGTWGDVIALAADGSLWLWPDREQYEDQTLLKLPKQPKLLGNLFDKTD